MKHLRTVALLALIAVCIVSAPACTGPRNEGSPEEIARRLLSHFDSQDFAAVFSMFDNTMKGLLPQADLQSTWQELTAQVGGYSHEIDLTTETGGKFVRVVMRSQFAKAVLDVQVTLNARREVSGLYFTVVQGYGYVEPGYVDRSRFSEEDLIINVSGDYPLPATLSLPVGDELWPAVVLVHGSGPSDRDETIISNKPFADIALGLSSRGVAVLRYDKRTYAHAQAMAAMTNVTLWEETVADAISAARFLLQDSRVDPDRVYVLGHSLGGMAAPRIGQALPELAGLIMLAAPARPLEDIMVEQYTYIFNLREDPDSHVAELEEIRAQAERVKDPDLSPVTPASALLGLPASYWLDLRGYIPPLLAQTLDMPMLILQGERDYQVTMEDFNTWKSYLVSRADVKFRSYPELNHLFFAGVGPSSPDEYFISGNVSLDVITEITRFVRP